MMITLTAEAAYGFEGKQYVARITGRDPKFTFRREFIGRKSGKRNDVTSADVDTPGLYAICDVDRKGDKEEAYRIVLAVEHDRLLELRTWRDNLDGLNGKDAAMQIAKRLDSGESIDQIIDVQTDAEGKAKYRLRSKAEAKQAAAAITIETATEQCWAILQALPEKEAKRVLAALKAKVSPPPQTQEAIA